MTRRRGSWFAVLSLAALGLAGPTPPADASSLTQRLDRDGGIGWAYHFNCITGDYEAISGSIVGYYGTNDFTWPRVNDLYYVHLTVSVVGNECAGGIYPLLELLPPTGTQFAISAANPVTCYYTNPQGQQSRVTSGCPQTYSIGAYGYRFVWPYVLPYATTLDLRVPVVSSQPLNGLSTGHYLHGYVSPTLGNWSVAEKGIVIAANDLIFQNGFESANLGAWTPVTDAGDLSVASWAAMRGSGYGLAALVDDTNPIYVQNDSPNNQGRYRMRFYLNPYTFNPGEAQGHFRTRVFLGLDETPQRRVLALILRRQGGNYALAVRVRRDDNSQADTAFYPLSAGAHSIEIDFQRASGAGASNGSLRLWIDDVLKQTLLGIDNDQAGIDHVRLGALSVKSGAGGMLLFDEMESRTTTAVGP
jgi:hypothetical protein